MPAAIASFSLSPADSARAVAQVYSVSLLATLPLIAAGAAAVGLQRASAATRALIWRSAAVGPVLIYFGQTLPFHWLSWALAEPLASPLIAIGRVQVSAPSITGSGGATLMWALLLVYITGVLTVLVSLMRDWLAARALVRRASPAGHPSLQPIVGDVRNRLGIRRE